MTGYADAEAAAHLFQVAPSTIRRWASAHPVRRLADPQHPRRRLYNLDDLDAVHRKVTG